MLVTSRHRGGYGTFGDELAIDVLDTGSAVRYLLDRTGRTSQETTDAEAVATALGCLPLALAHAGAYCAAGTGVPFGEYLELLEGLPSQDMFDASPEEFYQQTIAATWTTSITAAAQQAPLAGPALQMAAFLAPDAIPRPFFIVLAETSPAGRKQVADALAALHRYSLATVDGNWVSVHRLLQKVIRDQLTGQDQATAADHALTAIEQTKPDDPQLPAAWPQWQELLPHVTALADYEVAADVNATQLMTILIQTCNFLLYGGLSRQALDLTAQAVTIATGHLGPDHYNTLSARGNLAFAYWQAGRTEEAIAIEEQLAADRERLLGPEHSSTLRTKINLSASYWQAGRTAEAIALQEQLAADYERLVGPEHPDTLRVRGNLATSYMDAGRTADAITLGEQLAADYERLLGPEHPDTLRVRGNLATSYTQAGRTGEAITLHEQVVADRERLLGPDHPSTLTSKANLADVYTEAGRTGEAITLQEQVAAARYRLLGPDHPDTVLAKNNLAVSYYSAGQTGKAITLQEQVVADRERLLGPEHPHTLRARNNLEEMTREQRGEKPQED